MNIEYRIGNLFDGNELLICHGCNAQGVGNSGFFRELRTIIPMAWDAYRAAFDDSTHPFDLGSVIWAFDLLEGRQPRIVGNIITQEHYGREPGKRYVSYPAIERGLVRINEFVASTQDKTVFIDQIGPIDAVAFPLIGSGLGGGSWPHIAALIEATSRCYKPIVYTLDGVIPTD